MTTILLTGFAPFANDEVNPSGDAVARIAERWSGDEKLVTEILPVTFADAGARLIALINEHSPDLVIATGLAGNRASLSVERVAVNIRDARIADNAGAQPIDVPVIVDGENALFTTLPIKAMAKAISDEGIAAELSLSAGLFVCNDVFYHAVAAAPSGTRAGFIHVPWASGQAPDGAPSLPLDDIVRGLEIAIHTALSTTTDLNHSGGTIS